MHRNFHRENREILLVSATQRGSSTSRDGTVGERLRR
jgi:hypothetical protein